MWIKTPRSLQSDNVTFMRILITEMMIMPLSTTSIPGYLANTLLV